MPEDDERSLSQRAWHGCTSLALVTPLPWITQSLSLTIRREVGAAGRTLLLALLLARARRPGAYPTAE